MNSGSQVSTGLAGVLLLSQAAALPSAVRDAATLTPLPLLRLIYPVWHDVFTPFCGLADMITLFSYHQLVVFAAWFLVLAFLMGGLKKGLLSIVALLGFLAWGALLPRPMGRLSAADPEALIIDFHSHSQFSHDGRKSFTPEANRLWHMKQGYGAGFITDHNRTEASKAAKEKSREDWQVTRYRSLEGEEISLQKTHLVILGNHETVNNRPYDSDFAKIPLFIRDMNKLGYPVIASLPEYWKYHWIPLYAPDAGSVNDFLDWGISGFEIINSAPKALDYPLAKRLQIVDLCKRQNRFLTGISDSHGYGSATAVWNLMTIPGWRKLDPDQLEATVLKVLKVRKYEAVQVIERLRFMPQSKFLLALSPFGSIALYWRLLQPLQAFSWAVWLCLGGYLFYGRKA